MSWYSIVGAGDRAHNWSHGIGVMTIGHGGIGIQEDLLMVGQDRV